MISCSFLLIFAFKMLVFATHIPECLNNNGIQLLYDYFFIFCR